MTAVIDDVETVLDLSLLPDIDKEVPCESDCDKAATWVSIHRCCNFRILYCDEHRKEKLDFIQRIVNNPIAGLKCGNCNRPIQPRMLTWVKL